MVINKVYINSYNLGRQPPEVFTFGSEEDSKVFLVDVGDFMLRFTNRRDLWSCSPSLVIEMDNVLEPSQEDLDYLELTEGTKISELYRQALECINREASNV